MCPVQYSARPRACGWKTTVDLIKKIKPSHVHLDHELRTSPRRTSWGREKGERVIGFWDRVEFAHSSSRLLPAGWKCKRHLNRNLRFHATQIGVTCGACEIDGYTGHERPFRGLDVLKASVGASSASCLLARRRRWTDGFHAGQRTDILRLCPDMTRHAQG